MKEANRCENQLQRASMHRTQPIKTGTLVGILKRIAIHHGLSIEELLKKIDL